MGGPIRPMGARPWPERPVSEANKSGRHPLSERRARTCPRGPLAEYVVFRGFRAGLDESVHGNPKRVAGIRRPEVGAA